MRAYVASYLVAQLCAPLPALPQPTPGSVVRALPDDEERWPRDLEALRRRLGGQELERRVEPPPSTDVEYDVPLAIWHLMTVLEWRRRGSYAHPLAIRAFRRPALRLQPHWRCHRGRARGRARES